MHQYLDTGGDLEVGAWRVVLDPEDGGGGRVYTTRL